MKLEDGGQKSCALGFCALITLVSDTSTNQCLLGKGLGESTGCHVGPSSSYRLSESLFKSAGCNTRDVFLPAFPSDELVSAPM